LKFVENLIESFPISPEETRVGVGSFASNYRTDITFDKYSNVSDLTQAIKNVKQLYGNTNTAVALKAVLDDIFTKARPGAARLAVVMTDGESMHKTRTQHQAQLLKKDGVTVFAIGVGSRVNKMELLDIGSQPSDTFVHTVHDFDALDNIKNTIRETLAYQVCKGWFHFFVFLSFLFLFFVFLLHLPHISRPVRIN